MKHSFKRGMAILLAVILTISTGNSLTVFAEGNTSQQSEDEFVEERGQVESVETETNADTANNSETDFDTKEDISTEESKEEDVNTDASSSAIAEEPEKEDATPIPSSSAKAEESEETLEQNTSQDFERTSTKAKSAINAAYIYDVTFCQKAINYRTVTVTLPNAAKLYSINAADKVTINAVLSYGGKTKQTISKTVKIASLQESNSFEIEFPTYGRYEVSATFYKNGTAVKTTSKEELGIIAEEYNFANLNATFPVVQFTLSLWDMKQNGTTPVPTFVSLSRNDAYDWNKLPENVYELPYLTGNERESIGFTNKVKMTAKYIQELYELNPDSKFNLYCVDYTLTTMLYDIIGNNIPTDQYTVRVLSDGTASYTYFNTMFDVDTPQTTYDSMAVEWKNIREQYAKGIQAPLTSLKYSTSSDISSLKYYTYVVVNEEKQRGVDIEWWLARTSGTLQSKDAAFLARACQSVEDGGVIRLTPFAQMLTELQNKGKSVENEFKSLYHFSETMFSEAENNNKKAMMLLGTRVTSEANFEDYVHFCKLYYGDEYEYYYKGHPATPTDMYPEKQAQLNALNIHDVESSIAAELILYFYPDIAMSGYGSTTFISATKDMAGCLFGMTLAQAKATTDGNNYEDIIDCCISEISDFTTATGALANKNHKCYLVEFNKKVVTTKYDIAIWDATEQSIYYYVLKNGKYELGSKNVATRPVVTATGGQNQVSLSWNAIDGASEYRVYSYDTTTKKYTGVKKLTGTNCVVKNLDNGTKYTYLVRAYVNGIWSSYDTSNHASATTICAKPSVSISSTQNSLTLSWKKLSGAVKYRVYSYDMETNKYTKLADITDNKYRCTGLSDGTDYYYLVRAYNGTEFSPFTRNDNVSGITLCRAPHVIANGENQSISLNWSSVPGATYYRVYSYNTNTKTYKGLKNVTKTNCTITGLKAGTAYTYLVRAYNGKNYSAYTAANNITATTLCSKPVVKATSTANSITLKWSKVTGATKYRIYSYDSKTKKYTRLGDVTNTTFVSKSLKKATSYTYLVRAYNGVSMSPYQKSDNITATTLCTAPVVTATGGNRAVTLKWKAVSGAKYYRVYAYDTSTKTYKGIKNVTSTSYTITRLKAKTSYTYLVRAYNGTAYSAYTTVNNVTAETK